MNRELLERPFPPEQIRTRVGRHGKPLDYVDGRSVVQRLNEALDGAWSFQVERYEVRDDIGEVIVLGRLASGDVVKMQFGGSAITRSREGGEPLSLADDLKAASTDSLKKAASLLGVGLHLYSDDVPSPRREPSERVDTREASVPTHRSDMPPARQPRASSQGGNRFTPDTRLTSKQFSFVLGLIEEAGINRSRMDEYCRVTFGTVLAHITRAQATKTIDALLQGTLDLTSPSDGQPLLHQRQDGAGNPAPRTHAPA